MLVGKVWLVLWVTVLDQWPREESPFSLVVNILWASYIHFVWVCSGCKAEFTRYTYIVATLIATLKMVRAGGEQCKARLLLQMQHFATHGWFPIDTVKCKTSNCSTSALGSQVWLFFAMKVTCMKERAKVTEWPIHRVQYIQVVGALYNRYYR